MFTLATRDCSVYRASSQLSLECAPKLLEYKSNETNKFSKCKKYSAKRNNYNRRQKLERMILLLKSTQ